MLFTSYGLTATITFFPRPVLLGVVVTILLLSGVVRLGLQVLLALLDDLPLLLRLLLGHCCCLLRTLEGKQVEEDRFRLGPPKS